MIKQEFYSAEDIMTILNCKRTKAYTVIRQLNCELQEDGVKTCKGRVLKSYFDKTFGLSYD